LDAIFHYYVIIGIVMVLMVSGSVKMDIGRRLWLSGFGGRTNGTKKPCTAEVQGAVELSQE